MTYYYYYELYIYNKFESFLKVCRYLGNNFNLKSEFTSILCLDSLWRAIVIRKVYFWKVFSSDHIFCWESKNLKPYIINLINYDTERYQNAV